MNERVAFERVEGNVLQLAFIHLSGEFHTQYRISVDCPDTKPKPRNEETPNNNILLNKREAAR
jgi:hypothetical protein